MTQANGTTAAVSVAGPVSTGIAGVSMTFTPEQIQELLAELSEPFDPELVEWRVTNTAPGKNGPRGQVVAYADQRAYTDRLNELFTPLGWTREYGVQTAQNFEVPVRGKEKTTIVSAKVMVTCKVTIFGMGTHSGTGEEWATDENALTRAEAQAFKRACSCFGLGRYFYDLPRTWVDLDEYKRPLQTPALPEWAVPRNGAARPPKTRTNASPASGASSGSGRKRPAVGPSQTNGNGHRRGGVYTEELLKSLQALSEEVGFSLARDAVRRVTGKENLTEVRNPAKLTALMEKLDDLARGTRRLKAAVERAGPAAYASVCQGMNLASDSIDDIPDRTVLRQLVDRMEALAQGGHAPSKDPGANTGRSEPPAPVAAPESITALRDRLLIEARRVSAALRKGMGDVIAAASKGSFTFADVTKLTDTDLAKVEAALRELERMSSQGDSHSKDGKGVSEP